MAKKTKSKSKKKSPSKKSSDTIEILLPENFTAYLTPIAIVVGAIIISFTIILSFRRLEKIGVLGVSDTNTVKPENAQAPSVEEPKEPNYDRAYEYAKEIGLNRKKIIKCVDEDPYADERASDSKDAEGIGITGTPGFVVGKLSEDGTVTGSKIAGAYPYTTFEKVIEKYLNDTEFDANDPDLEGVEHDITISIDDDPAKGSKDAKVAIVEFSDYECPFCKRHALDTGMKIEENYVEKDKVLWVFRDLPLSFHEPVASTEALIAECAREQGGDDAYFKMHDFIFENTVGNSGGIQ